MSGIFGGKNWPKIYGTHGKKIEIHEDFVYALMKFGLFNIGCCIVISFDVVLLFALDSTLLLDLYIVYLFGI